VSKAETHNQRQGGDSSVHDAPHPEHLEKLPPNAILIDPVLSSESQPLEKERTQDLPIKKIISTDSLSDAIERELKSIHDYHIANINTAKRYLRDSEIAVGLSFLLILASVALLIFFHNTSQAILASAIPGLAGIILQFLGRTYLLLSKQSWEQINRFYESGLRVQDAMIADSFCASIIDERKKDEIRGSLATEAMNRSMTRGRT
jgi:hypothetical protein